MKERLLRFIKEMGVSQNTFEDRSGLSRGTITTLNKGIRSDKLAGIARAYPNLNIYYLLGLSDDMLLNDSPSGTRVAVMGYSASSNTDSALCEPKIEGYGQGAAYAERIVSGYEKSLEQKERELDFLRSEIEQKNKLISFFIEKK